MESNQLKSAPSLAMLDTWDNRWRNREGMLNEKTLGWEGVKTGRWGKGWRKREALHDWCGTNLTAALIKSFHGVLIHTKRRLCWILTSQFTLWMLKLNIWIFHWIYCIFEFLNTWANQTPSQIRALYSLSNSIKRCPNKGFYSHLQATFCITHKHWPLSPSLQNSSAPLWLIFNINHWASVCVNLPFVVKSNVHSAINSSY